MIQTSLNAYFTIYKLQVMYDHDESKDHKACVFQLHV
jgi:hypothetical protein